MGPILLNWNRTRVHARGKSIKDKTGQFLRKWKKKVTVCLNMSHFTKRFRQLRKCSVWKRNENFNFKDVFSTRKVKRKYSQTIWNGMWKRHLIAIGSDTRFIMVFYFIKKERKERKGYNHKHCIHRKENVKAPYVSRRNVLHHRTWMGITIE